MNSYEPPRPSDLEAPVAISTGSGAVTDKGWIVIADGHVELYDGRQDLVATAPADDVWARKRRVPASRALRLWIGADHFVLTPRAGERPPGLPFVDAGTLAAPAARRFGSQFLAALVDAGGHLGKRP